jgi:hypothetical protein
MGNKIGRNNLCWCGSRRKYKWCHLIRVDEKRLPFEAIASQVNKASKVQFCLHPDASATSCGAVVSAHTLQRSRVLKAIADAKNEVLTFFPFELDPHGKLKLHRRGWRKASTFFAFCKRHDDEAFAPLEKASFIGTMEQIFLIAYRAVCWELYQKTRAVKANRTYRDLLDRGSPVVIQRPVQRLLNVQNAAFQKGLNYLVAAKSRMDSAFQAKDYSEFSAYEIEIVGPVGIAATGAITPNRLMNGTILQSLRDPKAVIQWLAFGVDVRDNGASIVFLWRAADPAPTAVVEEFTELEDSKLSEFLAQFFFAYCENTYFAARWWASLNRDEQDFLIGLMANSNPYYFPPEFKLGLRISPWRAISRRRV